MPDLSELFKDAVGDVPPFDPALLAAKRRNRRRLQLVGAASTLAAIVAIAVVLTSGSGDNVALKTRPTDSTRAVSTTVPVRSTTAPSGSTTVSPARPGDIRSFLVVRPGSVKVGERVVVELGMHSVADHPIDLASGVPDRFRALLCARMTRDGRPAVPVELNVNVWAASSPVLFGDGSMYRTDYTPTTDDVGTVTCEAALFRWIAPGETLAFVAPTDSSTTN
jgi:hypothetical protein